MTYFLVIANLYLTVATFWLFLSLYLEIISCNCDFLLLMQFFLANFYDIVFHSVTYFLVISTLYLICCDYIFKFYSEAITGFHAFSWKKDKKHIFFPIVYWQNCGVSILWLLCCYNMLMVESPVLFWKNIPWIAMAEISRGKIICQIWFNTHVNSVSLMQGEQNGNIWPCCIKIKLRIH